jgi:hypothetical protein
VLRIRTDAGLEMNPEGTHMDLLRRVTDLFVEGNALPLGMDAENKPVVVWVNKLNSFEVEEARRDGVAQRGLRLMELSDPDGPELKAQRHHLSKLEEHELRAARVGQMGDEIYLRVMNDLEAEEEWVEKLGILRRLPSLLMDANAPADDPRHAQLEQLNAEYLQAVRDRLAKGERDALTDLEDVSRKDLEADYLEAWRQRLTLDDFMAERRKTEIFLALRQCKATAVGQGDERRFEHVDCDHTQRLLDERSQVHTLPEGLIARIIDVLDGITVPGRESGNSGAPASSSGSSEPTSAAEATSPASTPEATPSAAPTT